MRYEKGRKDATRNRIIEVASERFRKDGIAASGLAGIMSEAGLTNGAFYPHFDSKETLVREVIVHILQMQHERFKEIVQAGGIEAAIRYYLSMDHLEAPAIGCPSAALVPEIARAPMETRTAYLSGLEESIAILAEQLPDLGPDAARLKATGLFSLMLGTLQIARAAPSPDLARAILENGIESALLFVRKNPQGGGE
jgi:AcrR family transcriptional regulator